jgi:hypothetical protein
MVIARTPNPAVHALKLKSPGAKTLVVLRVRRPDVSVTPVANRSMIAVPPPGTPVARVRVVKIMVLRLIVMGIVNIMPRVLAREIAALAEVMKEAVGRAVRLRRPVVVNTLKAMGNVEVIQMRPAEAPSPGERFGGLNAGRRRVGFMPRDSALECIVGRVAAVTTDRILPTVVREGRTKAPGRCTVDRALVASLSDLATVRDIPGDRCLGVGRMNDITKDLVGRSSEAVVMTGLQGRRLREWTAAVVLVMHPKGCHRRGIVLKAAPLRRGASRKGVMLNPVVGIRGQIVPSTPWERRVSSRCHPGLEPIFHFTVKQGGPGHRAAFVFVHNGTKQVSPSGQRRASWRVG